MFQFRESINNISVYCVCKYTVCIFFCLLAGLYCISLQEIGVWMTEKILLEKGRGPVTPAGLTCWQTKHMF